MTDSEVQQFDISITGHGIEVTDAIRNHFASKLQKIEKFHPRLIQAHAVIEVQKRDCVVQLLIRFDKTKVKVSVHTEDLYFSIDTAVRKLSRKLARYKERLKKHHDRSIAAIEAPIDVVDFHAFSESEGPFARPDDASRVVAKKTVPIKHLTLPEAVMKLDLSSDSFMVYRSEEDQQLKVIYRRNDHHTFGVINVEENS